MKGLYLHKKDDYIEKATQNSGELRLIAKGEGTETMIQKIKAGKLFVAEPPGTEGIMELFYILEGAVVAQKEEEDVTLEKGDYFYIHGLKDSVHFKVRDDVTLLYTSTKPVFHYLSSTIADLSKIVKEVEDKDKYTFNHSERVQHYSIRIAEKLGLQRDRIEALGFASLFHDIGKVHISDKILNKPGALTYEEMLEIKNHPVSGKEMVRKTYYENIGEIIIQHHERLDGSGYPKSLKDKDILLEAKIIAVVDSYDAMTSDRIYRKAMETSKALEELKSLSGKLYAKEVVNALEEILEEENIIKRDY